MKWAALLTHIWNFLFEIYPGVELLGYWLYIISTFLVMPNWFQRGWILYDITTSRVSNCSPLCGLLTWYLIVTVTWLTGVQWNSRALCFSVVISVGEECSIPTLAIYIFLKFLLQSLVHFFTGLSVFFLLICWNSLYSLNIITFGAMWVADIFSFSLS